MSTVPAAVPDPRRFAEAAGVSARAAALYRLAEASLAAATGQEADANDVRLRGALSAALRGDGAMLALLLTQAPSVAVARHLWRQLDAAWEMVAKEGAGALAVTIFAMPLVVVVGMEGGEGEGTLAGTLPDPGALAALLRDHHALKGNQTFTLADALVAAEALELPQLPTLLRWTQLPDGRAPAFTAERALVPAPLAFAARRESAHLRFLVGSAIAKPQADLLADQSVGGWGMPLASELSRQLAHPGVSVLALPRAPERPLPALWHGRLAQRDVAAQLFASNAIRKLRGSVGEPTAIISAHRADDAMHGGELRLSLSSPFAPRDAEGFRCPLYPLDRVGDVAAMLAQLMQDCRVTDVRLVDGIHPDRDAGTGLPLLFKPDTLPPVALVLH